MNLKITVLGCGNSTGVPAIGNFWGACDPNEPKNRRARSSIAVQSGTSTLLIDTGPEVREQLNRENIQSIDAVLYTHAHADHIAGIDDLRAFYFRSKNLTPVYGNAETMNELQRRFHYLFSGGAREIYKPSLTANELSYGSHKIGDIEFTAMKQDHGSCMSIGYRFGDFAYSTDFWHLDETAIKALKGIKTWLVDATAYKESAENVKKLRVHAGLETIYELNRQIGAEQVYLTGLTLAMDYKTLINELPPGYKPAYDGLQIQL